MTTTTEQPDTLDLDSPRDQTLQDGVAHLFEPTPGEVKVLEGWFDTADIQIALLKKENVVATPDEVRRVLRHFAADLQVDTSEPIRDRWALFDPNSVQSLLRCALAQSSAERLTRGETTWLSQRFTQVIHGQETSSPSYRKDEEDVVGSLIEKGVLSWIGSDALGSGVEWTGPLGRLCRRGGEGERIFEDLPQSHGETIPDVDWAWRHGGIMYLSDSKPELEEKIRSVWTEHRREGPPPSPQPCEFESVLALAIDFEVRLLLPSDRR